MIQLKCVNPYGKSVRYDRWRSDELKYTAISIPLKTNKLFLGLLGINL